MPTYIRICIFFVMLFSNQLHAKELKQVTLNLSWFEQFQFAGYYVAKEKGYYQEAGLDVKILPFDIANQNKTVQRVIDGEIDFAIEKETLILQKMHHKNIVVLSATFQASPIALLSTKKSGLNKFEDFPGKYIMASLGDSQQASLKAMLNSNHIQTNTLKFLPHSHNINDLINGNTDLMSAYISKAPHDLNRMGVEFNVFSPKDYGFDLYSDFLYTSENFISKSLNETKAFRAASLKGWQYAFANIPETVNLLFNKYNQQNLTKEALLFEANELKKLAYLNNAELGHIDEYKFRKSFDLYKVLGMQAQRTEFSRIIFDPKHPHLYLTEKEKSYLKHKQKITMCIDPNWLPYDGFDQDGNHIGVNKGFMDIFRTQLPVPLEIIKTTSWTQSLLFAKERKCDLLSLAHSTEERLNFLNFTSPYLDFPQALVTKVSVPFINDISNLADKKIVMVVNYAQQNIIKNKYPNLTIIDVPSIEEGLEKVMNGQAFGLIDGLENVLYSLNNDYIGKLKISSKLDQIQGLGIAVRNDETHLLPIFEKLVSNLTPETIVRLTNKKPSIKYIKTFNYNLLWAVLFVIVLIISVFLNRQRALKKLNKSLNINVIEKTKALQDLNENLELKIKERTKKIEDSRELLQSVAYKDSLTGTFNRHYLFKKSISFFHLSCIHNEPLTMLLIDIDNFKLVNDSHGHIVGDNILKHVATGIQASLRTDDLLARYGGEEFILLLPKVSLEGSLVIAEKVRHYISQHHYPSNEHENLIRITISIGVTQYLEGESLEKFIDRADSALYCAKAKGRNQVQFSIGNDKQPS